MSQQPFYRVYTGAWPLVYVTFKHQPQRLEEFQEFLSAIGKSWDRHTPFTLIVNTKNIGYVPRPYQAALANFIEAKKAMSQLYLRKTYIYTEHAAIRLFLNAVFLIRPPARPYEISGDLSYVFRQTGMMTHMDELRRRKASRS